MSQPPQVTQSASVRDTRNCASALARALRPGDAVLLEGPLGAGKTAFVSGVARALGAPGQVSSPTFVFVHEYSARIPLVHVDLYRLPEGSDIEELGIREYLDGSRVVLVEWPGRCPSFDWGGRVWRVSISIEGDMHRRITVTPPEAEDCL